LRRDSQLTTYEGQTSVASSWFNTSQLSKCPK